MRGYEVKEYFLEIDFSCYETKNVVKKLIYNENDINTAFINIQLKNDGKIINLTDYEVIANIWKNIGNKVQNPCKILNAELGEIEVPLTRQSLKGAGVNPFTISIMSGERSLESPRFYYRVEEAVVSDDDIENADEFGVLVLLISQVKEVLKDNDLLVARVENLENLIEEQEEIRKTNEEDRKASEIIREASEVSRGNAEVVREEQEEDRKASEIIRETSEVSRENAEVIREEQEEDRKASEIIRETSEVSRGNAEVVREEQEEDRKASEIIRETSEVSRENAEVVREEQEEVRKTNEIVRQESIVNMKKELDIKTEEKFIEIDTKLGNKLKEQQKQVDDKVVEADETIEKMNTSTVNNTKKMDDKIVEVDNKIIEVDTAKTDMKTTIDNKLVEFENRFEELEGANTAGEVIQSRTASDGNKKDTLNERLNYDYNELDKKISETKVSITGIINDDIITLNNAYSSVKIDAKFDESLTKINENKTNISTNLDKINLIQDKIGSSELSTLSKNISDAVNELDASVKVLEAGGNLGQQLDSLKAKYDTLSNKVLDILIYLELESGAVDEVGQWYDNLTDSKGILSIDNLRLDTDRRRIFGSEGNVIFNKIDIPFSCYKVKYIHELDDNFIETISNTSTDVGANSIELEKYSYEVK
ncbi:hypothetical protein NYF05_07020 [Clostridioides difficile]|nr:hypothetical protein NYF05_07020 [Clostridioides difficile]